MCSGLVSTLAMRRSLPYLAGRAVVGVALQAGAVVEAIHASAGLALLAPPGPLSPPLPAVDPCRCQPWI